MNTARVKRHTKLMLRHPLEISKIPLIIAFVVCGYIFALGFFGLGYKSGVRIVSTYSVPKIPAPVNLNYLPSNANVYNIDLKTNSDELLTMDETDTQLNSEMNTLISNLDTPKKTHAAMVERAVPVERRMYNDRTLLKTETPDINVISGSSDTGFYYDKVILPVLALGFAVLGVNYMEQRAAERLALSKKKKAKKS